MGARKGKKNKKSKKNKKNKNKKNKSKKSGKGNTARQNYQGCGKAITDECLTNAIAFMKLMKDKVSNFQRQESRTSKQNSTGDKKNAKKNAFKGALNRLIEAGGGNASAMMCGKSSDNA